MKPFEYIAPFLEALVIANNRSRNVLLILSTASVLAFVGFWNSKPNNWVDARMALLSNKIEYLNGKNSIRVKEKEAAALREKCENEPKTAPPVTVANTSKTRKNTSNTNQAALPPQQNSNLNANIQSSPCQSLSNLNDEISKAIIKYNDLRFTSSRKSYESWEKENVLFENPSDFTFNSELAQATNDLRILERIRRDTITSFHVPFFGTSFDVNDLSLVSGITFTIILIWLRLSLWTELNSTQQVFERVNEEDLRNCYEYMSMHLVFTIPVALDSELRRFGEKQWKWVVKMLIVLPVTIQLLILANDLATINIGMLISEWNTVIVLVSGFTFFVTTALLTFSCLSIASTVNRLWKEQGEKIKSKFIRPDENQDNQNLVLRN